MKKYVLQAGISSQVTSCEIRARDNFSAKVLAANKISVNYVADKRYDIGDITLRDPNGKVVWEIKTEIRTEEKEKK